MKNFPNYIQADAKDCGPTCLKIVGKHYGKTINIQQLRDFSETTREGSNLLFLSDAADRSRTDFLCGTDFPVGPKSCLPDPVAFCAQPTRLPNFIAAALRLGHPHSPHCSRAVARG